MVVAEARAAEDAVRAAVETVAADVARADVAEMTAGGSPAG